MIKIVFKIVWNEKKKETKQRYIIMKDNRYTNKKTKIKNLYKERKKEKN